jgi:hypothetical protein
MPAFRFVGSMLLRSGETHLYTLKAGPAGAGSDTTETRGDLTAHSSWNGRRERIEHVVLGGRASEGRVQSTMGPWAGWAYLRL